LLLGVLAESGDQLVLAHSRAALDLQLTGAVAELLDTALLEAAPVRLGLLPVVLLGASTLAVRSLVGMRLF
jgi:hypothetical protein